MKKFAAIFILIAGMLWGCLGIFVRFLNGYGLFSLDIVFIRSIVTCIVMGLVIIFYNRQLLKIALKDIWCFIGTGILSIVFFNYCYFKAMTVTSLAVAAVLLYTAPAIVMVLSFILFKESLTVKKIISLILTFIGCVLVTGALTDPSQKVSGLGIFLGMGAGLGYALYSIFSRYAIEKGYHTMTITFYTFLFASIGTAFFANLPLIATTIQKDGSLLLWCIGMGIAGTVLPYLSYTLGLKYVENGKASIIASIEPVMATVIGILVFQEKLTILNLFGIALVLIALCICNITLKRDIKN